MKLITLNTHSIVEPDYEEKLYSFSRVVLEERPEILALQEVNCQRGTGAGDLAGRDGLPPLREKRRDGAGDSAYG